MSQFLHTEVEIAKTMIHIAKDTGDSDKRTRCIFHARKAYDAIEEFLPRTPLSHSETEQIRDSHSLLKSQLQDLGQNFNGSAQVLPQARRLHSAARKARRRIRRPVHPADTYAKAVREVKRFLLRCQQARAEAKRLQEQNKVIMERNRGTTRRFE